MHQYVCIRLSVLQALCQFWKFHISMTSVVPCCAQPLAPFDCDEKNRFLILHIIHKCQLYLPQQKSEGHILWMCNRRKQVIQQTLEQQHKYWHVNKCTEKISCTVSSQKNSDQPKNDMSVSSGMRSGFVKVTTVSSFHSALSCLGSSQTHQTQQWQLRNSIDDKEFTWINELTVTKFMMIG